MQVVDSKQVEECLDGVIIKELRMNHPVNEAFIRYLGNLGKLQYFPHFPRPFYKITQEGRFILKGVQGNTTCQVFFYHFSEETELNLKKYISQFVLEGKRFCEPL